MAIASVQGLAFRSHLTFRRPLFCFVVAQARRISSAGAFESLEETVALVGEEPRTSSSGNKVSNVDCNSQEWKKLSSKDLGIRSSMIARPTRLVLNGLRKRGYEVYLVGGCVRDLILNRTPKDFDIITSAELREVLRTFFRCEVVGRRFPICHVHIDDTIVEVSSFSTLGRKIGRRSRYSFKKYLDCKDDDFMRWQNCLHRDFTINGLMFDPFAKIVYDYIGGLEDIRKAKVRSIIPACTSFMEDCARILRGIRIAARLEFRFGKETAHYIKEFSSSVSKLDKGRILMEMNYMLAYGSAEASLRLLWKFGLLEILLPIQASYFVSQGFRRRDKRSNMLLSLFACLDKLLSPDRPCHSSLWISILAFHNALMDQPRDPLVVAAFSIAVHSSGSLLEAVRIARRISQPHAVYFNELSKDWGLNSDDMLIDEIIDLAASVKAALQRMTDEHFVSQALIKYPQAPNSDLVFISPAMSFKVCLIVDCVRRGKEKGFILKQGNKIDYEALALGRLHEVRRLFARIVFDTVYPSNLEDKDVFVQHSS